MSIPNIKPSELDENAKAADKDIEKKTDESSDDNNTESVGMKNLRETIARLSKENKQFREEFETEKNKKLLEEGKYQELLAAKDKLIEEQKGTLTALERKSIVEKALRDAGVNEQGFKILPNTVIKSHNWDSDGKIEDTIKQLKSEIPVLFSTVQPGAIGFGKNTEEMTDEQKLMESNSDADLARLIALRKRKE